MENNQTESGIGFTDYIIERTRDFTGREWVLAEIGRWLADPNAARYFIITGTPGIGKTAIAARLAQISDVAAFHFCIARQADTIDPINFARSLSHQLTRIDGFTQGILEDQRVHVDVQISIRESYGQVIGVQVENLISESESATVAFNRIVLSPLKRLYAGGYDQPLLILVDALDEAIQQRGQETIIDLLATAGSLPQQVRFILTSRPEEVVLRHFEQQRILYLDLDAGREENLRDVRLYVHNQVNKSSQLQACLTEHAMPPQAFVDMVTEASKGNFLYLVWLLPSIASGTRKFDDLSVAPEGLDGIYREFLRTRRLGRDLDRWRDYYRPLLGVLVAAQSPLTVVQLVLFTGLKEQEVDDLLVDTRQFLDPALARQRQYRLYHQSLIDFLSDKERAREFWIDAKSFHHQIASYYLESYGCNWDECDIYGVRSIIIHLLESTDAGRVAILVKTDFLRKKAILIGDAEALLDARQIAEALAKFGNKFWEALVECAYTYCDLADRVYARPDALVDLINRGNIQRAMAAIESESNPWKRGALMIAASTYLVQEGRVDLANHLRMEGALLASDGERDTQNEKQSKTVTHPAQILVRELIRRGADSQPSALPKPSNTSRSMTDYLEASTVQARRWIPPVCALAAYGASFALVLMGLSVFAYLLLGLFVVQLHNPYLTGLVLAGLVMSASLFVAAWYAGRWIMGRTALLSNILLGLARQMNHASPNKRRTILLRAIRFCALLQEKERLDPNLMALLAELVVPCFRHARSVDEAATILAACTAVEGVVCDRLTVELRCLGPTELAELLNIVVSKKRLLNPVALTRIYATIADITLDPDLLARLCAEMESFEDSYGKHAGKETFAGFSSLQLVSGLIAGLHLFRARSQVGVLSLIQSVKGLFDFVFRELGSWRPFLSFLDPLLWFLLVLSECVWGGIFSMFTVALVISWCILLAANHEYDPNLLRQPSAYEPSSLPQVASIEEWIRGRAGILERRRVQQSFLAHTLASGKSLEQISTELYPQNMLRRVVRTLRRRGMLGRHADMVLAAMGNRLLLDAITANKEDDYPEEHRRDSMIVDGQVERALPIASVWHSFLIMGLIVTCATVLWWQAGILLMPTGQVKQALLSSGPMLLGGALVLTVVQHWCRRATIGEFARFKGIAYIVPFLFGVKGNQSVSFLLAPFLIANVFVPEFTARWRGANLLYPGLILLWAQRVLSLILLVGLCLLLAVLTPHLPQWGFGIGILAYLVVCGIIVSELHK